nr:class I SAM-dependent methyltransferase [Bacillus sp. FJAT-44742]
MSAYQGFAYYYDELMEEAPYKEWVVWIEKTLTANEVTAPHLLDVGCGTGTIMTDLIKKGYRIDGVDASEEMLAVANEKMPKDQGSRLFCQDMRELEGLGVFDTVIVTCDSLNYLLTKKDVEKAFASFYSHLKTGGLLLFDVHSLSYMEDELAGFQFAESLENRSCIWNCYNGEDPYSVEHELTFFIKEEDGRYRRFDEFHYQRTFSQQEYEDMLRAQGFKNVRVTADFTDQPPGQGSDRLFFTAIKKDLQ